jgi:hypothetical protein
LSLISLKSCQKRYNNWGSKGGSKIIRRKPNFEKDGEIDFQKLDQWTESFFSSLMQIFNGFFSKLKPEEALERLQGVPFRQLCRDELEGEKKEIVNYAVKKIGELAEQEIQALQAYAAKAPETDN